MNMFEFFALALVLISVLYVVKTICETIKDIKKAEYSYFKTLNCKTCAKEEAEDEKI